MSKCLCDTDYTAAAKKLGVSEAAIRAVCEVEAPRGGFLPCGHTTILFERHIMHRLLKQKWGEATASRLAREAPDLVNTKPGGYGGTNSQPERLKRARKLDNHLALQSCSWGRFQIMGFHYAILGFKNPVDFVLFASGSEGNQLELFCRFLLLDSNRSMLTHLQCRNWAGFSRLYNGPNYAINRYDVKLAQAYRKWGGK